MGERLVVSLWATDWDASMMVAETVGQSRSFCALTNEDPTVARTNAIGDYSQYQYTSIYINNIYDIIINSTVLFNSNLPWSKIEQELILNLMIDNDYCCY